MRMMIHPCHSIQITALLFCGTLVAGEPKIENGFYRMVESGGIKVRTLNGEEIQLGEKLKVTADYSRLNVSSMSNKNDLFSLLVEKKGPFSEPIPNTALFVDGFCLIDPPGSGKENNLFYSNFPSETAATSFARHFNVKVVYRHHPHHEMLVSFVPEKEKYKTSSSVPVKLQIKNVGKEPFAFMVGGMEMFRDNQFAFAILNDHSVLDTGNSMILGGLMPVTILKPGKTFEKEVDLKGWFDFKERSTYPIRGSYSMNFVEPNADSFFTIWTDYATADFSVTIGDD